MIGSGSIVSRADYWAGCRSSFLGYPRRCRRVSVFWNPDFSVRTLMDSFREEKVRRFEEFVDTRLKPDLVRAISERDKVFGQQKVLPDAQRIFVDVGLGFHVEFTWSEALNYISLREEKLARQIEEFTHLIASIKAQIKLVCEGIRELLQLPE